MKNTDAYVIAAYVSLLVGIVISAIYPWLKKNQKLVDEGKPPEGFKAIFAYSAAANFILTGLTIVGALTNFVAPEGGFGAVIWASLLMGLGTQRFVNIPVEKYA